MHHSQPQTQSRQSRSLSRAPYSGGAAAAGPSSDRVDFDGPARSKPATPRALKSKLDDLEEDTELEDEV